MQIETKTFSRHFYVIDNHSEDGSYQQFHHSFSKKSDFTLLEASANLAYVGGNNLGINRALNDHCDYILIINNDVLVNPRFLIHLIDFCSSNESVGVVGPKIYFAPDHEFHHNRYSDNDRGKVIWSAGGSIDWKNVYCQNIGIDEVDSGQYNDNTDVDFLSGCCQLIKADVFRHIGLLDNNYFMYLEDVEFCQRAKKAGYQVSYVPDSFIWHINAGSSRAGGGALHDYFLTRNRLIFGLKYAPVRTKIALIKQSLGILLGGTMWQKKAIIDYYLHRWGRGSWR